MPLSHHSKLFLGVCFVYHQARVECVAHGEPTINTSLNREPVFANLKQRPSVGTQINNGTSAVKYYFSHENVALCGPGHIALTTTTKNVIPFVIKLDVYIDVHV